MVGRLRMLGLCGRRLEIGGQRRKERDGGGQRGQRGRAENPTGTSSLVCMRTYEDVIANGGLHCLSTMSVSAVELLMRASNANEWLGEWHRTSLGHCCSSCRSPPKPDS